MAEESEWISQLHKELIHLHQEYIWGNQLNLNVVTVVVVVVVEAAVVIEDHPLRITGGNQDMIDQDQEAIHQHKENTTTNNTTGIGSPSRRFTTIIN